MSNFNFRVSYKDDSRQRFCDSIVIQDQDHTLGNCLRYQLLQDKRIVFAGYKKPHPLEEKIEIKVQTNGEIPPPDAILDSCGKLSQTLGKLVDNFRQEVERERKEQQERIGQGISGGQGTSSNQLHMAF